MMIDALGLEIKELDVSPEIIGGRLTSESTGEEFEIEPGQLEILNKKMLFDHERLEQPLAVKHDEIIHFLIDFTNKHATEEQRFEVSKRFVWLGEQDYDPE